MDDIQTEHLRVDYLDRVFFADANDVDHMLGFIDTDPWWPTHELGPEPTWFPTELDELLDEWTDAQGNDTRPAAQTPYRLAIGDV